MSLFLKNAITILFLVRLPLSYPFHHLMSAKYEITARQMLKILKKAIASFNWNKACKNLSIDAKGELLIETI